jgi:hypothetical protein
VPAPTRPAAPLGTLCALVPVAVGAEVLGVEELAVFVPDEEPEDADFEVIVPDDEAVMDMDIDMEPEAEAEAAPPVTSTKGE